MSLINDMLRDLEKREQRQHNSSAHDSAPVVTTRQHPLKSVIVIGIVFVLIVLAWFGVGLFTTENPSEQLTTVSTTRSVVPPSSDQEEVAVRTSNLADIPVVTSQAEAPPAPDTFGKLSKLAIAQSEDQTILTLTFSQFQQYQLLDQGADGGLVVRFDHVQLGDNFEFPATADSLVKRISFIPESDELRLLVDLYPKTRLLSSQLVETDQHDFRLRITFVAEQLAANPVAADTVIHSAPLPVEEEKKREKEPSEVSPVIAKASKHAPAIARDKQAYRSGLEQLQAGQFGAAEASFVQALLVNPEFLDARLQLVALLQQQKKFSKAENFLQQGLSLTPDSPVLRKIYARQLLQEQRGHEAIALLQALPVPPMVHDLEYHVLLAAALQGVGEYRAASSLYAQLVKLRPQEGLWWLGMAVSLEQSGHRDTARDAYQKALSLPGLRPDLQSYIQSRLQAL